MSCVPFRQTWNPITSLLAQDFTCVRMDLRGHGASSAAPEYSMQSLVGDVRAVVEEVGLGEPAVVGHSLGASVAAVYAAATRMPDMIQATGAGLAIRPAARLIVSSAAGRGRGISHAPCFLANAVTGDAERRVRAGVPQISKGGLPSSRRHGPELRGQRGARGPRADRNAEADR